MIGHSRVGRQRGCEAAVVHAAVGPFGVAGVVVGGRAKLGVASRHAGGQPDDSSSIGRGRLCRVAAARIARVADVGGEGFHLRDAERLAQAVGEFRRCEIGVGVEGPVAPLARRRVVDEPGAKVESVCVRKDVRDLRATAGLGAKDEIRFTRAEERADASVLHRPPVLSESLRAEAVVPSLLKVHLHGRCALLKIGKDAAMDRPRAVVAHEGGAGRMEHARRKGAPGRLVVVRCQRELTDIVAAVTPPRRLAGRLHRRQEQADERADDGDHHQELDEGKTRPGIVKGSRHGKTTRANGVPVARWQNTVVSAKTRGDSFPARGEVFTGPAWSGAWPGRDRAAWRRRCGCRRRQRRPSA